MKKKLLFIMNSLQCGGAEKALISLLKTIDYHLYEIDLLLFNHSGLFIKKLSKNVRLLDQPVEYQYFDMPIKKAVKESLNNRRFDIVYNRLLAGLIFKTEKNPARSEQRVWAYISSVINSLEKEYDAAIGFLEKNPIYYCVDKVKARKKIGFIHTHYDKLGMDPFIDKKYFNQLDSIVTVSNECANVLEKRFPEFKEKIKIVGNIISPQLIQRLALEHHFQNKKGYTLISVGRLTALKGFEMAIKACSLLINNNYEVTWYVIGEGEERKTLERLIKESHLEKHFVLLGLKDNPYPYIFNADIYIQPSRFEGKSIALDEAKILQKPIVVTNYSTAKDQIDHGKNGLIVEMDAESIFRGIKKLIDNETLRDYLTKNLSKEDLGTEEEIKKFYQLIS